jgi:hypothetical protein
MQTRMIRHPITVIGLALLLALSIAVGTPHARATDPLTITSLTCDGGGGVIFCDSTVSGGTGDYTYNWKGISNAFFIGSTHGATVHGSCNIGQPFTVKLVVKDSAGAKTSDESFGSCTKIHE